MDQRVSERIAQLDHLSGNIGGMVNAMQLFDNFLAKDELEKIMDRIQRLEKHKGSVFSNTKLMIQYQNCSMLGYEGTDPTKLALRQAIYDFLTGNITKRFPTMNPPLPHILVLTDYPESAKLQRLYPDMAEDLINYTTKSANKLSARPRQIISLDNYGLALGFNPHVDQLKSFAFTHSVKGKTYWVGSCLRLVLCEVTMPYMVSADQQYLQAVENARSHVWRIGVIQMTDSLGSTTLSTSPENTTLGTSGDQMEADQRIADVPQIMKELQQITQQLIQKQCDVCGRICTNRS